MLSADGAVVMRAVNVRCRAFTGKKTSVDDAYNLTSQWNLHRAMVDASSVGGLGASARYLVLGQAAACLPLVDAMLASGAFGDDSTERLVQKSWSSMLHEQDLGSVEVSAGSRANNHSYDAIVILVPHFFDDLTDSCGTSILGSWLDVLSSVCVMSKRLLFVTSGVQVFDKSGYEEATLMEDSGAMMGSSLAGLIRSAQLEYPKVEVVLMDVPIDSTGFMELSTELLVWDGEMETCYHAGNRYIKRYETIVMTKPSAVTCDSVLTGSYIESGGLAASFSSFDDHGPRA